MRYFLPLLPVICILCARFLIDIGELTAHAKRWGVIGLLAGVVSYLLVVKVLHPDVIGADIVLSFWMFITLAISVVLNESPFGSRETKAKLMLVVIVANLATAFYGGMQDLWKSQLRRSWTASVSSSLEEEIEEPSITYGYLPFFGFQISREQGLISGDVRGLDLAAHSGFEVWVTNSRLELVLTQYPNLREVRSVDYNGGQAILLESVKR